MAIDRVKFQDIIENQLPNFMAEDFPLLTDFLKQYYVSQEFESGPLDISQNIDNYVKLDNAFKRSKSSVLATDIDDTDDVISASAAGNFTYGFPDRDGLLKIDDEIIYYEVKTDTSFEGCIRGFSGITSYRSINGPDELVFDETLSASHSAGAKIENLNVLFLQQFVNKIRGQYAPGFGERKLDNDVDQRNFVLGSKGFYESKGTVSGLEILFQALYGVEVDVIKPSEFLIRPSTSNYKVKKKYIAEIIEGDALDLKNRTLYQERTGARGSVSNVESVLYGDELYYILDIDSGYDKDINVSGSIFGEFQPIPKTRVLNTAGIGATIIDVDSTVSFGSTGNLVVIDPDDEEVIISYTSKNSNQFLGVSGLDFELKQEDFVQFDDFSYANIGIGETDTIRVRINTTLQDLKLGENFYNLTGDKIKVKSYGNSSINAKLKNWKLNNKTFYQLSKVELLDASQKTYRLSTIDGHNFTKSYKLKFYNAKKAFVYDLEVLSVNSANEIVVRSSNLISNLNDIYFIENQILKTTATNWANFSNYFANVQNAYTKGDNRIIVASNSIPYYDTDLDAKEKKYTFSGTYANALNLKITSGSNDHGLFTGDAVYYDTNFIKTTTFTPDGVKIEEEEESKFSGISKGLYYVKRVDKNNIRLAKGTANLEKGTFERLTGTVVNNKIIYFPHFKKIVSPQGIFRHITTPNNDETADTTTPLGGTGILINGVEIHNYKSNDKIFYGEAQGLEVLAEGSGYDVINPPLINIEDPVGTGATGVACVTGSLDRIDIIDGGYAFAGIPEVEITGGNGTGATAEARISAKYNEASFNAQSNSGVALTTNTIGFTTYHNISNQEEISYDNRKQTVVGGLSTNALYYAHTLNATSITLHETYSDAEVGINTINLTSFGQGEHCFKSVEKKNYVSSIVVKSAGEGYSNKRRLFGNVGVNTATNTFTIKNHGYKNKEIVRYSIGINTVTGISEGTDYYITNATTDTFKLSSVGSAGTTGADLDYDYNNNVFVDLTSEGDGSFNYQPITVSVTGVNNYIPFAGQDVTCRVQPVFRGSIKSTDMTAGGVGYGSSDILNFDKQPLITLISGEKAELQPIIFNGSIVEIIVLNSGSRYNSPPNLKINSPTGNFALLTPILVNGQITEVKVIKGGSGYVKDTTSIDVIPAGIGAKLKLVNDVWSINLFEKNIDLFGQDDGFIAQNLTGESLQYYHLYAPRKLRQRIFALENSSAIDNTKYGVPDFIEQNGIEVPSQNHSPIIGWAYDGNPIYGPYGYANRDGSGGIKKMKSGYELDAVTTNRPNYTPGFFIEDFNFTDSGDLDIHNGRFCVTPDYPNGVYAYFATINTVTDSIGAFENNFRPTFPYFIGESYKSLQDEFNFSNNSYQSIYDLEKDKWLRYTNTYNFESPFAGYNYVFDSNKLRELTYKVVNTSRGQVESINIKSAGDNYKFGDRVIFENENTGGFGAYAKVNRLKGKTINYIEASTLDYENVEFIPSGNNKTYIGFVSSFHEYLNRDIINVSGISSFYKGFDSTYRIGVSSESYSLTVGIDSTANTGFVTFFNVNGDLDNFVPNSIYKINNEKVKILSVDKLSSRVRVLRNQESTVGTAHSSADPMVEVPRTFSINVGSFTTSKLIERNNEFYIDPAETVGVGTVVGVGTTTTIANPGAGNSSVYLTAQRIFIPGHGLKLNSKLSYETNGGGTILYWNGVDNAVNYGANLTDIEILYVAPINDDFIGISSNKVGFGTTGGYVGLNTNSGLLFFTSVGTGNTHSFTTVNDNVLTATVRKNIITVATASTHGLQINDSVVIDVTPQSQDNIIVKYNDYNRRIVFNPIDFTSAGVNTVRNTINVGTNKLLKGDRVIHTSANPAVGLDDQAMYYVYPYSSSEIRLVREKYELDKASPNFVGITSVSNGTISRINPTINSFKNNDVVFDMSDPSLSFDKTGTLFSAFELQFFTDVQYQERFYTTSESNKFNIIEEGRVGIDSTAKVTLRLTDGVPKTLWYKFEQRSKSLSPDVKEIIVDDSVKLNNQINIEKTSYDGVHSIVGVGTTTFSYSIPETPQITRFDTNNSNNSYITNSKNALGPIAGFNFETGGFQYKVPPGISSVQSYFGKGADLEANSSNIGNILSFETENVGFNLPSDKTLTPTANIPQVLTINPLFSFENIGISSGGLNYIKAPQLVVIDGETGLVDENVELTYELNDREVTIIKNTFGLNGTTPRIVPTQNSNGVGISSIVYNNTTKIVRAYLDQQFSSFTPFPYSVGDKVLIENVNVGVGSTGKGYNSSIYGYKLFELTSIDPQLGGSGAYIEYSMNGLLKNSEVPGAMDPSISVARAIPEYQFPIFDPKLKSNDFLIGEAIVSGIKKGRVARWNPINGLLIVETNNEFIPGDVVEGQSSFTQGPLNTVRIFDGTLLTGAGATVVDGWQNEIGFLNDNLQRIPNNEYYQDFSYSIKSEIPYETWNEPVSALNHTLGFAKFSDLEVISQSDSGSDSKVDVLESVVSLFLDIESTSSVHTKADFDTAVEITKQFPGYEVSDEIKFENRIITDYFESVGNRVLSIDDFSDEFNSNARSEKFTKVANYQNNFIYNKHFAHVRDRLFTGERQSVIIQTLQDDSGLGYMNEYGKLFTANDLGNFDFLYGSTTDGWDLVFSPVKFKNNSYDVSLTSFNITDDIVGVGTTSIGTIVNTTSTQTDVSANTVTTLASIGTSYRAHKVLAMFDSGSNEYSATELNIIHDGTNVDTLEYGTIDNDPDGPVTGFGTFNTYISGGNLKIDFTPNTGIACTANLSIISISDNETTVGDNSMNLSRFASAYSSISASGTPSAVGFATITTPYESAYFFIVAEDTTNSNYECFEVCALYNGSNEFFVEFANVSTGATIGQVGIASITNGAELTFTPRANVAVQLRAFELEMQVDSDNGNSNLIDYENVKYLNKAGTYTGTAQDLKVKFDLLHNDLPIFKRDFDGSSSTIIDVANNKMIIPNHFFVTGERVTYSTVAGAGSSLSVGIVTQTIGGISTDKLPSDLYVVKVDEAGLRFAETAADALSSPANTFSFSSVGVGQSHKIASTNQDAKCLLAIDNMIQSPLTNTDITSSLSADVNTNVIISTSGITSITTNDLIKINDEIMKVDGVNVGGQNNLQVLRAQLGSSLEFHTSGDAIRKVSGDYTIRENQVVFIDPPFGQIPLSTTTGDPSYRDWEGITTNSTFQGRTFLKNALENTTNETYYNNYVFDDISTQFTGVKSDFTLQSNSSNVTGISTDNAIILINNILQEPQGQQSPDLQLGGFDLTESSGSTDIDFIGVANSFGHDQGAATIPSGGLIVSVGSSEGFGYQPLVAAAGTAIVSGLGTISSISIGNSGSGYRSGIQTVNVGVCTHSTGLVNLTIVGVATVLDGHVTGVAITNPGAGFTHSSAPFVVIDDPSSYSNVPLIYSSDSASGVGTEATVDIVVGQGSSVIDFSINNGGYGFGNNEILTVAIGGTTGIPTDTSKTFSEFQLTIESVFKDKFSGWSIGQLQTFDNFDDQFDGFERVFRLQIEGTTTPIKSRPGSLVDVEQVLLIFLNGVLQKPGEAYTFNGGSLITFSQAPKKGDTSKVLFYKGGGDVDVVFNDVAATIKVGDDIQLINDPYRGQSLALKQNPRTTIGINTLDSFETNPYNSATQPGVSVDKTLSRIAYWTKQLKDIIVDNENINKDRPEYEPDVFPAAFVTSEVGTGSTQVYVDNIRPLFNSSNENPTNIYRDKIELISQNTIISAAGTATVSYAGTISSLNITNAGLGYSSAPTVTIAGQVGIASTATGIAILSGNTVGVLSVTNAGSGYTNTNPPVVLVGSPSYVSEEIGITTFAGDYGKIVGFSTQVDGAKQQLVLDLYVPTDSFMRDSDYVGAGITVSGISTGDFFVVRNSNVSLNSGIVTSLKTDNSTTLGITTTFIDCLFQAESVQQVNANVIGVGVTAFIRVEVNVDDVSTTSGLALTNFYGDYTWGRIDFNGRGSVPQHFSFYAENGSSGLSTSALLVRANPLKSSNYIIV